MKIGLVVSVKPSHPYLEDERAPLFDLHYLRISPWLWFSIQSVELRCQLWYAILALTYLELCVLHRVGYKGTFFPRVAYYPQAIPVPWAQAD